MTYNNALKSCHMLLYIYTSTSMFRLLAILFITATRSLLYMAAYYKQVLENPLPLHQKKEEIKGRNMTRMIRSPRKAHLVARYVNTQETSAKTLTFSDENERWGSRCGMTEAFIISLLKRCTMIYTTYS